MARHTLPILPAPKFCPTNGPSAAPRAKITPRANGSMRVATPSAATASGPYPATMRVMITAASGTIMFVPADGRPI